MSQRKKHPKGLTFERLMSVKRLSDPQVAPDGKRVAFVLTTPDLAANKFHHTIQLLDLETGKVRELTPGPGDHQQPAWSPDGQSLAFASDREHREGQQLWVLPLAGGEARRVTSGYGGVRRPVWAPDSKRIAFQRSVVVSRDYAPAKREAVDPKQGPQSSRIYGLANRQSTAQIADTLLFRHWDEWRDRRRNHLFLVDLQSGRLTDLTPFDRDVPPISLGSDQDYAFSPDGREIAYAMNPDEVVARSTNNCIFVQEIHGVRPVGEARRISITDACDDHPRYSGDGKQIYYRGMKVPGYEADRHRIRVYDRQSGKTSVLLERFDRNPGSFAVGRSGGRECILFSAEDRGRQAIYRLDLAKGGSVDQLTAGTYNALFRLIPASDDLLVVRETTTQPADLYRLSPGEGIRPRLGRGPVTDPMPTDAGARVERLTHYGDVLAAVQMNEAEEFWFAGADDDPVHGYLIKPAAFNSRKRYPLILLIHGGPQTAFMDHFHYRWSAQLFASEGAVVAFLNPRGSTGYGQRFTDQISRDWGGRCYRDIMAGVDHLLEHYSFIDPNRMAAAGASFGGYMVNWIAGHTKRFRALVSHDGVFFAETMAYTTDELWFDEYEHGGLPHENRRPYLKFSPHLFVDRFETPTLVIQGGRDFRCPMSEGLGMFTALQVRGVRSRFVHFPDEGHWILGIANAQVWYQEVLGWMMKYIR